MSEYIKDYYRVSKLMMHYQKYNRWIKYSFAFLLIVFGGNLQWTLMFSAMIFAYMFIPIAFDGVGFILPLTDEERIKRKLVGSMISVIELSFCAAVGKIIWYILEREGILGKSETSVMVRYPLFSVIFFLTSVIAAADVCFDTVLGMYQWDIFKETKTLKKEFSYIVKVIFQGLPAFIFFSYGFAMCLNFKWIYHFDDMGNKEHLLKLLIAMVLFAIHIILTIHRSLKECRDFY